MALSPQQIAGQTSVLCKFIKPDYDSAFGSAGEFFKNTGLDSSLANLSNYAGLLGPVSKSYKLVPISSAPIDIKHSHIESMHIEKTHMDNIVQCMVIN